MTKLFSDPAAQAKYEHLMAGGHQIQELYPDGTMSIYRRFPSKLFGVLDPFGDVRWYYASSTVQKSLMNITSERVAVNGYPGMLSCSRWGYYCEVDETNTRVFADYVKAPDNGHNVTPEHKAATRQLCIARAVESVNKFHAAQKQRG